MLRSLMSHRGLLLILGVVVLGVVAVGGSSMLSGSHSAPVTRVFTLDAARFAYHPERLRVQQGDHVEIQLNAKDVSHGFYLDGYDLETIFSPGSPGKISFIADRPGMYRFRCAATCGPLHPFMIGELNVESNTPFTNTPYLAATAATLLVAVGAVVYSGRREGDSDGSGS